MQGRHKNKAKHNKTNKQSNKQTNKQTNKQANNNKKQTNKENYFWTDQTKQMISCISIYANGFFLYHTLTPHLLYI
jgi:hypothetical protein